MLKRIDLYSQSSSVRKLQKLSRRFNGDSYALRSLFVYKSVLKKRPAYLIKVQILHL